MTVWCICDFFKTGMARPLVGRVYTAPVLCCLRFDLSTAMAEMCSSSRFLKDSDPGIRLHGRENRADRQVQV